MSTISIYVSIGLLLLVLAFFLGQRLGKLKAKEREGKALHRRKLLEAKLETLTRQAAEKEQHHQKQVDQLHREYKGQLAELKKEKEHFRIEQEQAHIKLERRNTEFKNLEEQVLHRKKETEALHKKFENEFQLLANKLLDEKSEKFTTLNKNNLNNILGPLQKKIQDFEGKIEQNQKDSIKRHAELGQQLKQLGAQNQRISQEALNLTKALKGDTKTQGNWGEVILERVLEKSGLTKGTEYTVQESFRTQQGNRVQPDVVIHLPENKKMIVDAKVSLIAYEQYINTTDTKEKKQLLKRHLQSVLKHITELAQKNYHQLYQEESPDFVLLFIPIEAAFAAASKVKPNLYTEAFDKNIILVTPTTLLAVLKTINAMWRNEKQAQNALEIATQAGNLYDTFINLIKELERLGTQMGTTQKTYDRAMKKLTGNRNLLKNIERLKELGAKTSKQLPEALKKQIKTN